MKKILLAMAVLFGCAPMSFAQNYLVATLQHERNFSHFYGSDALNSAYSAATAGDIITLSPGTFSWNSSWFAKGITLRGAGIDAKKKSYISGSVSFCSTDSSSVTKVEGIYFSSNVYITNYYSEKGQGTIIFIKNAFSGLSSNVANTWSTKRGPIVRLYNNAIYSNFSFDQRSFPDYFIYNCYVVNPYVNSYDNGFKTTTTAFINCVINYTSNEANWAHYLNFYNCIFNWTYGNYQTQNSWNLPNTATCYNCLSINKSYLFNNLQAGGNNKYVSKADDVFKTYRNGYTLNRGEFFELTDSAQTVYLGIDNTQIGMQGGNYPYNTKVQYPIITTFSSDVQTSKEGILNISVEVDGQ